MKKILKWLLGFDKPIPMKKLKIAYLAGYDNRLGHADILRGVNDFLRPFGRRVEPEDFWVLNYHDLQNKFDFQEDTGPLNTFFNELMDQTGDHVVVMHNGSCTHMWQYSRQLCTIMLKCKGKRSYCNIGYSMHHREGTSYVVGKSNMQLVEPDVELRTESKNFEYVQGQMFNGLGS